MIFLLISLNGKIGDFDFEQILGSVVPGTTSRNSLLMDILFTSRSCHEEKLVLSFRRNLHVCDWFNTRESKGENCCRGK